MKRIAILFTFAMLVVALLPGASAVLKLDSIQFDPAIIAAGDEVDIVVQYHHESVEEENMIGNTDYTFKVLLEPDDTLTKDYVIVQDAEGDDVAGSIYTSGYYNKRFRVKVMNNAPAGNYEFKLSGRWFKDGEPLDTYQYVRFMMPVKKEGIILNIASLDTLPAEVRPGDNYVEVSAMVENVGEKDAKSVEITLDTPEGIDASYTSNNRIWSGRVNAGESKPATFFVDLDEAAGSGVYDIEFQMKYMDIDNNQYSKTIKLPFLVKSRPYIEVAKSEGEGLAGGDGKLYITVKNTGEESAEAVDVRIIKQNSQPFTMDVRSDYIGELEPGEEGLAVFDLGIDRDAEAKEYYFKVLVRSKGDSDEGDDNIYTYNRRAEFDVTGQAPNNLRNYGVAAAAGVVVLIGVNAIWRKKK